MRKESSVEQRALPAPAPSHVAATRGRSRALGRAGPLRLPELGPCPPARHRRPDPQRTLWALGQLCQHCPARGGRSGRAGRVGPGRAPAGSAAGARAPGASGRDAVREDGGTAATGCRGAGRLGRRAAALPAAALLGAGALHFQHPLLVLLRLCHPALPA